VNALTRESLLREIEQVLDRHRAEVDRLQLQIVRQGVAKHMDTWEVPVIVGWKDGDAGEVADLIRNIRRDIENQTSESVSVFIDIADAA
jgi:hypothetical protein